MGGSEFAGEGEMKSESRTPKSERSRSGCFALGLEFFDPRDVLVIKDGVTHVAEIVSWTRGEYDAGVGHERVIRVAHGEAPAIVHANAHRLVVGLADKSTQLFGFHVPKMPNGTASVNAVAAVDLLAGRKPRFVVDEKVYAAANLWAKVK